VARVAVTADDRVIALRAMIVPVPVHVAVIPVLAGSGDFITLIVSPPISPLVGNVFRLKAKLDPLLASLPPSWSTYQIDKITLP
jgi:hypothetical protein